MILRELKEIIGIALIALFIMIGLNFSLVLIDKKMHINLASENSKSIQDIEKDLLPK